MTITLRNEGPFIMGYQGDLERQTITYGEVGKLTLLPEQQDVTIFDEPGGTEVIGVAHPLTEAEGGYWEGIYHEAGIEFILNGTNGLASLLFG